MSQVTSAKITDSSFEIGERYLIRTTDRIFAGTVVVSRDNCVVMRHSARIAMTGESLNELAGRPLVEIKQYAGFIGICLNAVDRIAKIKLHTSVSIGGADGPEDAADRIRRA